MQILLLSHRIKKNILNDLADNVYYLIFYLDSKYKKRKRETS